MSVLISSSQRTGKKVVAKTLAILSHLPAWLISRVEQAIKQGGLQRHSRLGSP